MQTPPKCGSAADVRYVSGGDARERTVHRGPSQEKNRSDPQALTCAGCGRAGRAPQARSRDGLCDWCLEPLGDIATELNGGIGHPECAQFVWDAIEGPGALPWRPQWQWHRESEWQAFLRRLGAAAVRHGIDPHKLARALQEARP
jgi:hypothetical protein